MGIYTIRETSYLFLEIVLYENCISFIVQITHVFTPVYPNHGFRKGNCRQQIFFKDNDYPVKQFGAKSTLCGLQSWDAGSNYQLTMNNYQL